jgi:hypothetical protein
MRYNPNSLPALRVVLIGLPDNKRVEVERAIGVSANTVGELRKVTTWPENLTITVERHDPKSAVKISKASVAELSRPPLSSPSPSSMESAQAEPLRKTEVLS